MTPSDLSAVVAIAEVVHPSYPEDTEVLAERLRLYPQGCFAFERDGAVTGYILSHPWDDTPPALNTLLGALPSQPTTYYIHDIALLPAEHRKGTGPAIIGRLIDHARQAGFVSASLVAVNGTERFWQKLGFRNHTDGRMREKLKTYGAGAMYMRVRLSL